MFSRLHTFIGGTHIDAAKNLNCRTADRGYPRTRESRAAALYAYRSSCQTIGTAWRKGISWTKESPKPTGGSQQQYPCQCQRHGVGSERRFLPNGTVAACMVIKNDGQDTLDPTITPRESGLVLPPDEIRQLLAEKGIVGMGRCNLPDTCQIRAAEQRPHH